MDEIDKAAEVTRLFTAAALSKRKPVERSHGYCLSCNDPVQPVQRAYCNQYCREDHEKQEGALKRNGEG
jgi:hypothetical protein